MDFTIQKIYVILIVSKISNHFFNYFLKLELSDNSISGNELEKLQVYKDSLSILKICNNKISTLEQISKLKEIKNLVKLDLSGNEICDIENYRDEVFKALP